MMRIVFPFLLAILCLPIYSQSDSKPLREESNKALTIGILNGGGSLIGADFEALVSPTVGFQVGAGFSGLGAGMNFHLKPGVRSSFISLQYWHQGFDRDYSQQLFGPSFVYRGKKWFTTQLGLGYVISKGINNNSPAKEGSIILTYSIGGYFNL